ncbi:hypothetical protein [Streptomyces sp. NPDC058457]|uniref:hypothetical protein n=1 Tax=Streptomyces sp. NPDC058457 TaxID=3346507 RepID=UPI00364E2C00
MTTTVTTPTAHRGPTAHPPQAHLRPTARTAHAQRSATAFALPVHRSIAVRTAPAHQPLAALMVLAVTGVALHTAGASSVGGGHAGHAAVDAGYGSADPTVAVGRVGAVLAVTLAMSWPALRVVLTPGARRLTGRCVLTAAAAAAVLAVPLLLVRAPDGTDAHVWAMVRFESLAVLGPVLLARAVAATGPPSAGERGGARLGAAVWAVSAYAWHLPPLHGLDGPGIELARSFSWVTAGVLLCRHPVAPRGPFLVAHLAVLPLAALMAADGRGAAGLLMASADAAMAAACVLDVRRRKSCYAHVNIGSNYWPSGSFHRYGLCDRDRKASDARGRERAAHQDGPGHARRGLDAPLLAARRPERGTRRRTAPGGPEGAGAGPRPVPGRGR